MGYQRRAASFSFLGNDLLPKNLQVVPDEEDRASLVLRPAPIKGGVDGTVTMSFSEFVRGRNASPAVCWTSVA